MRNSINQKAVTREVLMEKLALKGEMSLRMRVIGMDIHTGVLQVMHQPFFGNAGKDNSTKVAQKGEKNQDGRII